jgi:protein-L-isoaspartate(D-aspartate) O-methyltransferase
MNSPGTPLDSSIPARYEAELQKLIAEGIVARGVHDSAVLAAIARIPRHQFVPPESINVAYRNKPLGIGYGQTISQPYVVALMTEAVAPKPSDRCLEIGTGSGYQTALLAELSARVYSIECLPQLARFGEANLRGAGYDSTRVSLRLGDGRAGWPEESPFDVIVVTAAPKEVPPALQRQLAVGGRLAIPIGPPGGEQSLELWTRIALGDTPAAFHKQTLLPVYFVPLVTPNLK